MPTYDRFEDLPVWNTAAELAEAADAFLEAVGKRLSWSKRDQLDRAAVARIKAWFSGQGSGGTLTLRVSGTLGTTNKLLAFLYIAKGSAGEVLSMRTIFGRRPALRGLVSEISNLKSLAEFCSRQRLLDAFPPGHPARSKE